VTQIENTPPKGEGKTLDLNRRKLLARLGPLYSTQIPPFTLFVVSVLPAEMWLVIDVRSAQICPPLLLSSVWTPGHRQVDVDNAR